MLLFWKNKDDPETAGRKALLDYLKSLEKLNCIRWSYRKAPTFGTIDVFGPIEELIIIVGQSNNLNIELTCKFSYYPDKPTGVVTYKHFKSLTVSLEGNGILNLDETTVPRCIDPRIAHIMDRATKGAKETQKMQLSLENQERGREAERAAHQILSHLSTS